MALKLSRGTTRVVELEIAVGDDRGVPATGAWLAPPHGGVAADRWLSERTRVEVDDQLIDRVLRRSLLDLRLLSSELDGHRYYAAGVPWYATLFGRDALVTALQTIAFDPTMAADTLRLLALHLGTRHDDEHDEEPGKVLHELRVGELADAGLTPLTRYYGSVDATPLFLCLLCEHADWSGSLALFRELREQVERALRWIDEEGDLDGDGLLEYRCRSSKGLPNQGWKDSDDGIVDEHGALLRAPIALVEVQGYALRAKRRLAQLYELDGQPARAGRAACRRRPARPRDRALLARGPRLLRDGARRRQAPEPRAGLKPGAPAVVAGGPAAARRGDPRRAHERRRVLGLGRADARLRRARVQPDRLPHRLDLAARHRPARARLARVRLRRAVRARVRRPARRGRELPRLPAARAVRRLPAAPVRVARPLPGGVLAAGVGRAARCPRC